MESHLVLYTTELGDLNLNNIPVVQVLRLLHTHGHTRRRTSQNNSTSLQRSSLTAKANNFLNTEKQITGAGVLTLLAVDERLEEQVGGVANDTGGDKDGAQRGELVKTFAEAPLRNTAGLFRVTLPAAAGDVVAGDVAGDVREDGFLGDVLASLANYDGLESISE